MLKILLWKKGEKDFYGGAHFLFIDKTKYALHSTSLFCQDSIQNYKIFHGKGKTGIFRFFPLLKKENMSHSQYLATIIFF